MSLWQKIKDQIWGVPTDQVDILNFRTINETRYRGGQPVDVFEWEELPRMGVKTVIKLNEDYEGSDDLAAKVGLSVVKCQINFLDQTLGSPSMDVVRAAVAAMESGNCFVHCEHGEDRTGLVVGCYRVWVCKWTKQAAQDEMGACGFHWFSLPGLANFWRDHVE